MKSLILLRPETYAVSVSSGLSVADPKYFFPAAIATTERPAFDVAVGAGDDPVGDDGVVPAPFYNHVLVLDTNTPSEQTRTGKH